MPKPPPTCVLLMSAHQHLADSAEDFCRRLFTVRYTCRRERRDNAMPQELSDLIRGGEIDYLLNFLSPIIIPGDVLAAVKRDAINFHPAPPEWPGVGSASYALYHGEKTFGVTAHQMIPKVDSGPIYDVLRFPILPGDDCEAVFRRAIEHALVQFYYLLPRLAADGALKPSGDTWKRKPIKRKEFEAWMTMTPDTPPDEMKRKIRATRHPRYSGPYLQVGNWRFELPPGPCDLP